MNRSKLHDYIYACEDKEATDAWVKLIYDYNDKLNKLNYCKSLIRAYRILSILLMILSLILLYR